MEGSKNSLTFLDEFLNTFHKLPITLNLWIGVYDTK
jgi:hypothetical protein